MGRKPKIQKNQEYEFQNINDIDNEYDDQYLDSYEEDDILKQFQNPDEAFQKQMTKKRRSKQFYVKGKDLIQQIRKYQQSIKTDPQGKGYISQELGTMILKICTRFSLHPKFFGYSYRDQMVADAVTRCLTKGVARINLDLVNCNPFSYFTQIALNCFRARINTQKKFMLTKQKFREEIYDQYEQQQQLNRTKDNQIEDF